MLWFVYKIEPDPHGTRQTLILARVSRHFLTERCAEWRFTVGYAGEVAKEYDNERLDPALQIRAKSPVLR